MVSGSVISAMAKVIGKNGAILASGSPSGVAPKGWSLSLNQDYLDVTAFGEANRAYLVGKTELTIEGEPKNLSDVTEIASMVEESGLDSRQRDMWYDWLREQIYDLMDK
jgi:hypothetical protein